MSGDYYSSSRHHHDRHHRDNRRSRDYYDRRRSRERDSRDSNRDHYKQHRVPGHVSEPDRRLEDVDGAISRGQRETLSRGRDYSSPYKTSTLPEYRPPVTVSQPYLTKFNANYTKTWRRAFYNASFLAVLPGVVGFALLIAAIIVPEWTIDTVTSGDGLRVSHCFDKAFVFVNPPVKVGTELSLPLNSHQHCALSFEPTRLRLLQMMSINKSNCRIY